MNVVDFLIISPLPPISQILEGTTAVPEFKLFTEIVALSVADEWNDAKLEWDLIDVYLTDDPETCLCGHYPIIELCVLQNRVNGESATVGNHCVHKFLGLTSKKIFDSLKRVRRNVDAALNPATIEHAYSKNWITEREYSFYLDTWRNRILSGRQVDWRRAINDKVLMRINRSGQG